MIGGASVTDEWKTKSRELKVESGEEEEKGEEGEEEGEGEEEEEEEEVKVEEEKANKQRSYFVRVGERAIWTIDLPLDWANQASMKDHVQPPTPDSFLQLSSLPPLPPPPSPASCIVVFLFTLLPLLSHDAIRVADGRRMVALL
ncbi:hypothetical protein HZH66_011748 [Vespula vulgaris]|uniref:Uncharacterized protein n=1 Tax=Vespula vulgaris TaxID=7454 RepID=A0A834JI50_VESVU|nr:hypothetical protein HZH66_011748 [Vespula vulgaris]